jgi:hypothetical protein
MDQGSLSNRLEAEIIFRFLSHTQGHEEKRELLTGFGQPICIDSNPDRKT